MIFQEESSDKDAEPSCLRRAELDDETNGKALYSPLFSQEREEPAAEDKLITLVKKVCCQLSLFCVSLKNGEARTRT